jgi:acetyl-CoA carboxylase carboxyl transferase subunit alpha
VGRLDLERRLNELRQAAGAADIDISDEIAKLQEKIAKAKDVGQAWKKVEIARKVERPSALDYIKLICDDFIELHGDRAFGDDPAMIGGIGTVEGRAITFIGNQKGSNLRENLLRNFGMANPEGYRKALRLAKQAEKFGRPIVTFIDTPGAYPGIGAEERGIAEAIARNLMEFARLRTPILCFLIGEGGSGGALGIGVGDKIYMLEHSIYSVISPEGYASILLKDASKAKDAAGKMKITSADVKRFKIVNGIIPEPEGGAHEAPALVAGRIKAILIENLDRLAKVNKKTLVAYRNRKIRSIGMYKEEE